MCVIICTTLEGDVLGDISRRPRDISLIHPLKVWYMQYIYQYQRNHVQIGDTCLKKRGSLVKVYVCMY